MWCRCPFPLVLLPIFKHDNFANVLPNGLQITNWSFNPPNFWVVQAKNGRLGTNKSENSNRNWFFNAWKQKDKSRYKTGHWSVLAICSTCHVGAIRLICLCLTKLPPTNSQFGLLKSVPSLLFQLQIQSHIHITFHANSSRSIMPLSWIILSRANSPHPESQPLAFFLLNYFSFFINPCGKWKPICNFLYSAGLWVLLFN